MELPREVIALSPEAQLAILDTIQTNLDELRQLNGQTGGPPGLSRQPWLMVNCGLRVHRAGGGGWRTSVVFTWPDIWGDFDRDVREAVLGAVDAMLGDARQLLKLRHDERS